MGASGPRWGGDTHKAGGGGRDATRRRRTRSCRYSRQEGVSPAADREGLRRSGSCPGGGGRWCVPAPPSRSEPCRVVSCPHGGHRFPLPFAGGRGTRSIPRPGLVLAAACRTGGCRWARPLAPPIPGEGRGAGGGCKGGRDLLPRWVVLGGFRGGPPPAGVGEHPGVGGWEGDAAHPGAQGDSAALECDPPPPDTVRGGGLSPEPPQASPAPFPIIFGDPTAQISPLGSSRCFPEA